LPSLEEFFILRKFRRSGIGRRAAYEVFDRFPGRWQLSQTANNRVAHAFWRRIIDDYTGGKFEERSDPTNHWCTTWQTFRSPGIERGARTST
jgi:predicted acetyltransferase